MHSMKSCNMVSKKTTDAASNLPHITNVANVTRNNIMMAVMACDDSSMWYAKMDEIHVQETLYRGQCLP